MSAPIERLGTEKIRAVLKIQSVVFSSVQKHLKKQGFLQVTPPIIAPVTDPGIRGAKKFYVDYYGEQCSLTSSMIFHKIALATAMRGKVYAFSPCLRKEPRETATTKRHLCEFWQIDVEEYKATYEDAMSTAEKLLQAVVEEVGKECVEELKILGREMKLIKLPLPRITHKQVVDKARELGLKADYYRELQWEAEKGISMEYDTPFFITKYPRVSREFYDRIDPEKPDELLDFDLIFDSGYGEAASGGEREHEVKIVKQKIKDAGLGEEDFAWYLEMIGKEDCRTAGFGMGLERLTRYLCGLDSVEEATPFPRAPRMQKLLIQQKGGE